MITLNACLNGSSFEIILMARGFPSRFHAAFACRRFVSLGSASRLFPQGSNPYPQQMHLHRAKSWQFPGLYRSEWDSWRQTHRYHVRTIYSVSRVELERPWYISHLAWTHHKSPEEKCSRYSNDIHLMTSLHEIPPRIHRRQTRTWRVLSTLFHSCDRSDSHNTFISYSSASSLNSFGNRTCLLWLLSPYIPYSPTPASSHLDVEILRSSDRDNLCLWETSHCLFNWHPLL